MFRPSRYGGSGHRAPGAAPRVATFWRQFRSMGNAAEEAARNDEEEAEDETAHLARAESCDSRRGIHSARREQSSRRIEGNGTAARGRRSALCAREVLSSSERKLEGACAAHGGRDRVRIRGCTKQARNKNLPFANWRAESAHQDKADEGTGYSDEAKPNPEEPPPDWIPNPLRGPGLGPGPGRKICALARATSTRHRDRETGSDTRSGDREEGSGPDGP